MPPTFSKKFAKISTDTEKQPSEKVIARTMSGRKKDIRYLFSVILCVVAVLATGAAYGANIYLDRQIVTIGNNINSQEETIQLGMINDLITFDRQIRVLKDLSLSRSGYLTLLRGISAIVVDGVQYRVAEFSLGKDSLYTVRVQGTAASLEVYLTQLNVVREVAKQDTDIFAKRMTFDSYNIQRNKNGTSSISFAMSMRVNANEFISSEESNQAL